MKSRLRHVVMTYLLLGCTGCAQCAEPLSIRMPDRVDSLPTEVTDACEFVGIACELSGRTYGSVFVTLVEVQPGEHILGENWGAGSCRPGFWSDPTRNNRVAHELGHILLGPEHSDDEENFMFHSGGDDITDEQLDDIVTEANRIVACR